MGFKEKLKELRIAKGLPQREVAEVLDYGFTAIANYEAGRNEPSLSDLVRLADYFCISLDELLERDFGIPRNQEEQLLKDFKKLNQNQKQLILNMMECLLEK